MTSGIIDIEIIKHKNNTIMKKILLILWVAAMSGWFMKSYAFCQVQAPEGLYLPYISVHGTLVETGYPCEEGEVCPPCLTVALQTEDKTYYLSGLDESQQEKIEKELYRQQDAMVPATVTGTPYQRGSFDYIMANAVLMDDASVYGSWTVISGGNEILSSVTIYRNSDYTYGYSGSIFANDGEFGEMGYTIDGNQMHVTRYCVLLDEPGYEDHCSVSFTTTFSLEDDVLTLDSFAYEQGDFMHGLKLVRDTKRTADVLLSGKWYSIEGNDSIIYNFYPGHNGKGGIYDIKGDSRLAGTLPEYSLSPEADWGTWLLTISNSHLEFQYIITKLTEEEMAWLYEEDGRTLYRYWKHAPIYEKEESEESPLTGSWQVYKATYTGIMWDEEGAPYIGSRTYDVNTDRYWVFDSKTAYEACNTCEPLPKPYTMQQQFDGTWLLTIHGVYDMAKPSDPAASGNSPITIHKMTETEIEWEYTRYGGDEGPSTYYQYLRHPKKEDTDTDTIPLYTLAGDNPGSSTIDPVDPNQVVVTLTGNELTIREHSGALIGYSLTLSSVSATSPHPSPKEREKGREADVQTETFQNSITVILSDEGEYGLLLTNPNWEHNIGCVFLYPQAHKGIDPIPGPDNTTRKIIHDGQLYILRDGHLYTITGVEVR